MNHASANESDDDGWIVAACICGWKFGPVPDDETATDALMDHAYQMGMERQAEAEKVARDLERFA